MPMPRGSRGRIKTTQFDELEMAICGTRIAEAIRTIEPSKNQKSLAVISQRSLRKKLTLGGLNSVGIGGDKGIPI